MLFLHAPTTAGMSHRHNIKINHVNHNRPHEEKCGDRNNHGGHGRGLRAFGGSLGLWFLRPRRKEEGEPTTAQEETSTVPTTTVEQHRPLLRTTTATTLTGGAKRKDVRPQTSWIEWDDIRCRPVVVVNGYGTAAAAAYGTEDETSASSDDDETEGAWNTAAITTESCEHQQSPHSSGSVTATPDAFSKSGDATPWILRVVDKGEGESLAPPRRHHRRTYSTKKRRNPWSFTPPMGYYPSKRGRVQGMSGDEATPAMGSQDHEGASSAPPTGPSSICVRPTGVEGDPTVVSGNLDAPPKLKGGLEQDCESGGTETPVRQPTHSTSLSAARRFFQRLDAHHPLVLDRASGGEDCSHPTTHLAIEGRSRRRPVDETIVHPVVSREYRQHRAVCHDVGVPALSWRHFLRQRAWYHTGAYEGMLDDW